MNSLSLTNEKELSKSSLHLNNELLKEVWPINSTYKRQQKIMEISNSLLQNFQIQQLVDPEAPYLNRFLKSSNHRLELIKSGRRLDNLISSDAPLYKKDKQLLQLIKKPSSLLPASSFPPPSSLQLNSSPFSFLPHPSASVKKTNSIQLKKLEEFIAETKENAPLVTNYLKNKTFNQEGEIKKFNNLKNYFKEKFQLMTRFLSEDALKTFITHNPHDSLPSKEPKTLQKDNSKEEEEDEMKELVTFFQKEEEKSESTLKKIIKINNEINLQLLREEHERKMARLGEFKLQQNRQLFKLINELPKEIKNPEPFLFVHKRPKTMGDGICKRVFLRRSREKEGGVEKEEGGARREEEGRIMEDGGFKKEEIVGEGGMRTREETKMRGYNPNIDPNNQKISEMLGGWGTPNYQKISRASMRDSNEPKNYNSKMSSTAASDFAWLRSSYRFETSPRTSTAETHILPDSLRGLISRQRQFAERPKYLTKFNKTEYKTRKEGGWRKEEEGKRGTEGGVRGERGWSRDGGLNKVQKMEEEGKKEEGGRRFGEKMKMGGGRLELGGGRIGSSGVKLEEGGKREEGGWEEKEEKGGSFLNYVDSRDWKNNYG